MRKEGKRRGCCEILVVVGVMGEGRFCFDGLCVVVVLVSLHRE